MGPEVLGYGDGVGQWPFAFVFEFSEKSRVRIRREACFVRTYAGHERCATGVAGWGRAIGVRESDALIGQSLNIGCHPIGDFGSKLFVGVDSLQKVSRIFCEDGTDGFHIVDCNKQDVRGLLIFVGCGLGSAGNKQKGGENNTEKIIHVAAVVSFQLRIAKGIRIAKNNLMLPVTEQI